ncbi:hypothetical protein EJ05DRAFT_496331 [Pseudovirgaria hyperparasitica]|uniref:Rhodopsin domain-containing protein n=1 Tax=Pseudovirgaria hyperparasitica TaxID=470096 RepID=A0A6A6WNB6_9PEZI|nr:uncharacterized protein EJ05DRAFT_496331 [Pseudovirgaria hyperparasitica]KAF2763512.1 hypothetical protein EJ05DRAFT_496331 [Pseudovirgaria hyperparasitica]
MYSSYSVTVVGCSIAFPFFAIIAVGFRLYGRRLQHVPWLSDDYLVVSALMFGIALCLISLNAAFNASLGQDLTEITPDQYVAFNKHIYALVLTAYTSFGLVKLSVLSLYKRIFAVPKFLRAANILFCIISLWIIVTIFLAIFSAWPISNFWSLGADYAFDHPRFLFINTILDTFFDVIVLSLPFPIIWGLQMSKSRKLQVTAIFSLGFFCVVSAGLRIYFGWRLSGTGASTQNQVSSDNFSYIVINNVIWCEMEACCSVIAACLPCMRPFMKPLKLDSFSHLVSRLRSWSSHSQNSRGTSRKHSSGSDSSGDEVQLTPVGSVRNLIVISKETQTDPENVPSQGVQVTQQYAVQYNPKFPQEHFTGDHAV